MKANTELETMWKGAGVIFSDIVLYGLRRSTANFSQGLEVHITRFEPGMF
jgi:hypothetical protein